MGIFRLNADMLGRSNIEPQGLELHPALKSPQTAQHIVFQAIPVGQFLDWHPAPRRQYVISQSSKCGVRNTTYACQEDPQVDS